MIKYNFTTKYSFGQYGLSEKFPTQGIDHFCNIFTTTDYYLISPSPALLPLIS